MSIKYQVFPSQLPWLHRQGRLRLATYSPDLSSLDYRWVWRGGQCWSLNKSCNWSHKQFRYYYWM